MVSANSYVIREAGAADVSAVARLAELDGQPPLAGRVLIGEIDGIPAAAVSLDDGRIVADPCQSTDRLAPLLCMSCRSMQRAA
jgi:hypothetical protein